MAEVVFVGLVALLSCVVICLSMSVLRGWMHRRCEARNRLLMRRATGELMQQLLEDDFRPISLERVVGGRWLLLEVCRRLGTALYGYDGRLLMRHLVHFGVIEALLRRVARQRGLRRAVALQALADLPLPDVVAERVRPYLQEDVREVRFAALVVMLSLSPHEAIRLLADYEEPLTTCEVGEVLHQLRRALLPIAYHPLLVSEHPNLKRLGLLLVYRFSIEEADEELLRMVDDVQDEELALAAIYTLCALHRPLQGCRIRAYVERLTMAERRALMRRMAREGYAPSQLCEVWNERQLLRYERVVETYKGELVWS